MKTTTDKSVSRKKVSAKILAVTVVASTALAVSAAAVQPALADAGRTSEYSASNGPEQKDGLHLETPNTLAGRVVDVKFDNGAASTLTFSQDGKTVSYKDLESGAVSTVPVTVVKNYAGLFLVTWYEPDTKYTVTHLQNYYLGTLSSTWTYPGDNGKMVVEGHKGTLELKN